jgi:hypothetical protein
MRKNFKELTAIRAGIVAWFIDQSLQATARRCLALDRKSSIRFDDRVLTLKMRRR